MTTLTISKARTAVLCVSLLLVALPVPAPAQSNSLAAAWGTQGKSCQAPPANESRPWLNAAYSPECRARYALNAFGSVEEKLFWISPTRAATRAAQQPAQATPPPAAEPASGARCSFAPQVDPVFKAAPVLAQRPVVPNTPRNPPDTPVGNPASQPVVRDMRDVLALPAVGRSSDGPAGVRGANCVTAFNTPLSVAATFDAAMAQKYGDLIGRDFHDAGYNFQLGPAADIARTWRFGRATESFGEDPFLSGLTAGAEVRGIAAQHVLSQMKHYAVYNQEQGRVGDQPSGQNPAGNEVLSERALREIYLPAFESAVRVGGAGRVMCSFPRINGIYACEEPHLIGILKNEMGFDGTVGPDFPSAQRSIVPAFMAGLDSGTTIANNGTFKGQIGLAEGVAQGIVPEARLDDIILRTLIPQFRVGVFEHPAQRVGDDVSTPERRAQVVDIITAGSVLLKNANDVLPLGPRVKTIAIIGAQATERAEVVEQGSAIVNLQHFEPVLPAIKARAGRKVKVNFAQGTWGLEPLSAAPAAWFAAPKGGQGVQAEFFANPNMDFSAAPVAVRTLPTLDLAGAPADVQLPANLQWSARLTTQFTPQKSGMQKFSVHGAGTMHLIINGELKARIERADFGDAVYANVPGEAGKPLSIRIEFAARSALRPGPAEQFGAIGGAQVLFGYAPPDDLIAQAARAAASADVAVVFVGHKVGEGMDRTSLALPNDQDALIEAVARANPRTVVVLNTGGAVTMPWLNRVAAVLQMWLPGDAYGPAAAQLLFGDAEPGGRLPITFPADESQGPATHPYQYPGTLDAQGRIDTAWFDEGIFVGYRYWDQHAQQPLFPFGFGLSYAKFEVGTPTLSRAAEGGARITVSVRNVSQRKGSQVLQAYVGLPREASAPPRQLKAVGKVTLAPGESREVVLDLDASAFRWWDEASHGWRKSAAAYRVAVGRSSRDILWEQAFTP